MPHGKHIPTSGPLHLLFSLEFSSWGYGSIWKYSLFPLGLRSNATLPERCKIVMPPQAHPSDLALLDFLHSTYYHLTCWVLTHLVVYYLPLPIDYKLHKDKNFDLFPATSQNLEQSLAQSLCLINFAEWMNEWFMPPPVSTVCGRSFGGVCPTPYNPPLWEVFFPNHGGTCRHSFSMWPSPWHCSLDQSWKAVEPMRISETLVPSFDIWKGLEVRFVSQEAEKSAEGE